MLGAIHKQRLLIGGGREDPLRADKRRLKLVPSFGLSQRSF